MKQFTQISLVVIVSLNLIAFGSFSSVASASTTPNFGSNDVKLSQHDIESAARSLTAESLLDDDLFAGVSVPKAEDVAVVPVTKEEILSDKLGRISDEFAIPAGLEKRVAFWFDIYTKHSDKTHLVHHVLYPWVVFKTIDTTPIYSSNLHKWTKYHKAKKVVSQEVAQVRAALKRLTKRSNYNNLKGLEKEIYTALLQVKGSRKKVIREAAANMRVQLGQRDFFLSGLRSSAKYLPYMEQEFRAAGLPTELARLPFVESSFNEKAHSKVGASGIWQIMPATGRMYFRVNELIDERNSPLKASVAATDIFRSNYKQLKDWPLAVTAYNHGVGGLRKNMRKARAKNLPDLIAKYHAGSFKFASSNFYTSFLAALHAERYHNEIFSKEEIIRDEPMIHHVFALRSPTHVNKVLKMTGLDKHTFLTYNLDLKNAMAKNAKLPSGFKLLLPPTAKKNLEMNLGPALLKEAENMTLSRPKGSRG